MTYKYNPKNEGSGIICAIPQSEPCPMKCEDCFFLGGRSYLEPLKDNLPNMPTRKQVGNQVVRVNDGGDSSIDISRVVKDTVKYPLRFYNTSLDNFITDLDSFLEPVILTINPGQLTDINFYRLENIPSNLMFVRVRVNMWNLSIVSGAVNYYSSAPSGERVPIVLTFMAYPDDDKIPMIHRHAYTWRKRTLNPYWAINTISWKRVMQMFELNKWVYSCGTEGQYGTSLCRFCGNCLREFYATKERMAECQH